MFRLQSRYKMFMALCAIVTMVVLVWIVMDPPRQLSLFPKWIREGEYRSGYTHITTAVPKTIYAGNNKPWQKHVTTSPKKISRVNNVPYIFNISYLPPKYYKNNTNYPIRTFPMIPENAAFRTDTETRDPGVRTDHNSLLSDIQFALKTTEKYHETRLKYLLYSMEELNRSQVEIFTDTDKTNFAARMHGFHLITTECGRTHNRLHLCCKFNKMLDIMNTEKYRWFCIGDDDTYFNYVNLMGVLNRYDWRVPAIVGKCNRYKLIMRGNRGPKTFVGGGPGNCMTRALVRQIAPYARDRGYEKYCDVIKRNADTCFGAFGQMYAGVEGMHEPTFHRDLHKPEELKSMTSVGIGDVQPVLNTIKPAFNDTYDPTRTVKNIHKATTWVIHGINMYSVWRW